MSLRAVFYLKAAGQKILPALLTRGAAHAILATWLVTRLINQITNQQERGSRINPATALKGINLLVDAGLLYKKRGVGMFVASGAREKLRQSRRERFYQDYVQRMVREARNLGLTDQELLELLERGMKEDGH